MGTHAGKSLTNQLFPHRQTVPTLKTIAEEEEKVLRNLEYKSIKCSFTGGLFPLMIQLTACFKPFINQNIFPVAENSYQKRFLMKKKKKPGHGVYRYKSFISIFGSEAGE